MDTRSIKAQREPNLYEFEGSDTQITYSTTSCAAAPLLIYQTKGKARSFHGDEIRAQPTEIGRLLTVTLEVIPDLHTITLSIFVPPANIDGRAVKLRTTAIRTTMRTSIAGPRLVKGQLAHYEAIELDGEARSVTF